MWCVYIVYMIDLVDKNIQLIVSFQSKLACCVLLLLVSSMNCELLLKSNGILNTACINL